MPASNKVANYVLLLLAVTALYFAWVYVPIYWDNVEIKQAARVWISSSREDTQKVIDKNRHDFDYNVRSLGVTLPESACSYTRTGDDGGKVQCDYVRDLEFPFTGKKKPLRFRFVVTQKFNRF